MYQIEKTNNSALITLYTNIILTNKSDITRKTQRSLMIMRWGGKALVGI